MLSSVQYLVNMIDRNIQSDEMVPPEYDMDAGEYQEFQRDYNRWCLEVELAQIEELNKTVNQNS
jgi:hypothetical protein